MSEHQTRITTQMGGTFQALDGVRARLDAIERSTKRANAAAKDHQATLSKGLGVNAAKAAQKIGGQGGAIAGQVAAGAGMDGVFGKLAVGAAVVGFAFRALNSVIESRVAQERQMIELTGKLRDGLAGAAKSAAQSAIGGLGQEGAVRKLVARGGSVDDANVVARQAGVSFEDAAAGLADIALEASKLARMRMEQAGIMGAKLGGGFGDTIGAINNDRFAKRLVEDGRIEEAVARVMSGKGGAKMSADDVRRGLRNVGGSQYLSETDKANAEGLRIGDNQRERVANGEALGAIKQQVADALNPQAAAILKWNEAIAEQVAQLEALGRAQGAFGRVLANIGTLMGGAGSFTNQAERLKNTTDIVVNGPGSPIAGRER